MNLAFRLWKWKACHGILNIIFPFDDDDDDEFSATVQCYSSIKLINRYYLLLQQLSSHAPPFLLCLSLFVCRMLCKSDKPSIIIIITY